MPQWLVSAWSADAAQEAFEISDTARFRLTPEGLADALKGDAALPVLPPETR